MLELQDKTRYQQGIIPGKKSIPGLQMDELLLYPHWLRKWKESKLFPSFFLEGH